MTSTQHTELNIHFQIPGRQLQMVSVEVVCNILCACTYYMVSIAAKSCGLPTLSATLSVTLGAFLNYPKPPMMQNYSRTHLMHPLICPVPDI